MARPAGVSKIADATARRGVIGIFAASGDCGRAVFACNAWPEHLRLPARRENFSREITVGFKIRTRSRPASLPLAWNVRLVGAALALALVSAAGDAVRADDTCPLGPPAGSPSCQPKFKLNGYDKGQKTLINTCQTNTSSSPCAWADVSTEKQNFLACSLEVNGSYRALLLFRSAWPTKPDPKLHLFSGEKCRSM